MKNYKTLSDNELLEMLKTGDEDVFNELYQRYWAPMYFYARKLFQYNTEAEGCRTGYIGLWDKRLDLDITGSFAAYLYSSVRNNAISTIQRKKDMASIWILFQTSFKLILYIKMLYKF